MYDPSVMISCLWNGSPTSVPRGLGRMTRVSLPPTHDSPASIASTTAAPPCAPRSSCSSAFVGARGGEASCAVGAVVLS